jgi:hypothetical protein
MPYREEAAAVIDLWRHVQKALREAEPDSPEAERLIDEWARLRLEYERLVDLATEHDRPEPMEWPEIPRRRGAG